jgi:hypothetical protein
MLPKSLVSPQCPPFKPHPLSSIGDIDYRDEALKASATTSYYLQPLLSVPALLFIRSVPAAGSQCDSHASARVQLDITRSGLSFLFVIPDVHAVDALLRHA